MNKKLIKHSLRDPNVAKELFSAVSSVHGELAIIDVGSIASRTTFQDANGNLYSTMVFGFFTDALEYVIRRRPTAWTEKAVVMVTTECWRGDFAVLRSKGATKICIVNLGGVVSRSHNYAHREMALLCKGAIISPVTSLGKEITKIKEKQNERCA